MAICRFWGKGTCKNGTNCRFDHIGPPGQDIAGGGGGRPFNAPGNNPPQNYGNQTTFGGRHPQGQSNYGAKQVYPGGRTPTGPQAGPQALPFLLSKDNMIADLTTELPQWILSAYGPGLKAPVQLFGGEEREKSFEEMRLNHYALRAQGQEALAAHQENELIQNASAQIQNALNNIDDALQYVMRGEHEHPNRIDIAEQYTKGIINPAIPIPGPPQTSPPIGPSGQAGFGANPPGFNALGQPVQQQGTSGAFGTGQSILGQEPNPFGGQGAFSSPSQTLGQSGFGSNPLAPQPFAGQPAINTVQPPQPIQPSPFGQQPQQSALGSFGSGSAFQQNAPAPFSAQSQGPTGPNPFGSAQPNQPQTQSPFGPPQSQQPAQPSPFGQTGGQPVNGFSTGATPFGTTPSTTSIGQQGGGFGPSAPSGPQAVNPFAPIPQGQPQQPAQGSHFGPSAATGRAADPNPYPPGSSAQHPHPATYSSRDASNRLTMFKGKRVVYKDNQPGFQNHDGSWEKIWFPDGPPGYYAATELPEESYDQATKNAYQKFRETGEWEGGKLPLLPPRREWSNWNF